VHNTHIRTGVPIVIIARTDAESARLMTSDVDERDHEFIDRAQSRTTEGFYQMKDDGLQVKLAHDWISQCLIF